MAAFDSRLVVLVLRVIQAIFAIIVLGLTAYGMCDHPSHVLSS